MQPARAPKWAGLSRGSFVHPCSTPLEELDCTRAMCSRPEGRAAALLLRPFGGFDQSTLWRPDWPRMTEFCYRVYETE